MSGYEGSDFEWLLSSDFKPTQFMLGNVEKFLNQPFIKCSKKKSCLVICFLSHWFWSAQIHICKQMQLISGVFINTPNWDVLKVSVLPVLSLSTNKTTTINIPYHISSLSSLFLLRSNLTATYFKRWVFLFCGPFDVVVNILLSILIIYYLSIQFMFASYIWLSGWPGGLGDSGGGAPCSHHHVG